MRAVSKSVLNTFACTVLAGATAAWACWWAGWHPVWPVGAPLAAFAVVLLCAWRPWLGPGLLAGALPWFNQTVHTGWLVLDEFDLLLLAVAGGSWAAQALRPRALSRRALALAGALCALAALGWLRAWSEGAAALPLEPAQAFADYQSPLNAWRTSKALLWAALLLPLWVGEGVADEADRAGGGRRCFARSWWAGSLIGLAVVCALVLLERGLYADLLDLRSSYRTTAWFWEMHVGGGAIDAYLALSVPLAAWWLLRAPGRRTWWLAALLFVCACHAALTTQSRGVYGAVAGGVFLAWWLNRHPPLDQGASRAPRFGAALVALAVLGQVGWALLGSSAIAQRLAQSGMDWGQRVQHWGQIAAALDGPADWALGIGAGRLPAFMAERSGGGVPGRVLWQPKPEGGWHMVLQGPSHAGLDGARFAAVQRLRDFQPGDYRVRLRYLAQPGLALLVSVCERHLIYDRRCQWRFVRHEHEAAVAAGPQAVVRELTLSGDAFTPDAPLAAWREGFFTVSVLTPGGSTRVDSVELFDAQGRQQLLNGDFAAGAARWLPAAQGHFEPWHTDNLYLEWLVERGLPVLLGVLALWAWALWRGWRAMHAGDPLAGAWVASLCAMGALGCFISLGELPRLAWWWWISLGLCWTFKPITSRNRHL